MRKNDKMEEAGRPQPSDPAIAIRLATFDQYRGLLFSIAYRMLGSVADAEDMLQETCIRWQQTSKDEIESVSRLARTNGEPGVVSYLDGNPYSVVTLDAVGTRVQAIYVVTNPEKLVHLPPLSADSN